MDVLGVNHLQRGYSPKTRQFARRVNGIWDIFDIPECANPAQSYAQVTGGATS